MGAVGIGRRLIPIKLLFSPSGASWRCFCSHLPSPSLSQSSSPADLQVLREIVSSCSGSLDDMETSLYRLGFPLTHLLFSQVVDSFMPSASNGGTPSVGSSRRLLRFFSWFRRVHEIVVGDREEAFIDDAFNRTICALAEMKDIFGLRIAICDLQKEQRIMEPEAFVSAIDALVSTDRQEEAVGLFMRTLKKRNGELLLLLRKRNGWSGILATVHALCAKGHASLAQDLLLRNRKQIDFDEDAHAIRKCILHAWCVRGNVKEARQVMEEMKVAGNSLSLLSYNSFLQCLCRCNLRFNPSALVSDATIVLMEMRSAGIPPTTASYNILLSCLSRARRVKESCELLQELVTRREDGSSPDWVSYYLVIRLLYLMKRFGRGNLLLDRMINEGIMPGARFYRGLIGVLCGMDNLDRALQLFERMKELCEESVGKTYDLLIVKLCRCGRFDDARLLWDEATGRGLPLLCSIDLLDPLKNKVFKPVRPLKKSVRLKAIQLVSRRKKNVVRSKSKVTRKKLCRRTS